MEKQAKIESILSGTPLSRQNNALCFTGGNCLPGETAGGGLLGLIQRILKKYGRLYYFLVELLAPVLFSHAFVRLRQEVAERNDAERVVVNIGSGPKRLLGREDIINVDMFAFDEVDIVSAGDELPFADQSVDAFFILAVLEHVKDPQETAAEMWRCLKPGGEILCYVPFMQPFHAAPHDYRRWSVKGVCELFPAGAEVVSGVGAGPTSGMLWVWQEWLALLLSFGIPVLRDFFFMLLMCCTFPLKYLDLLLEHYSGAHKTASGIYLHVRKNN